MKTKTCIHCNTRKIVTEFAPVNTKNGYLASACKTCSSAYAREKYLDKKNSRKEIDHACQSEILKTIKALEKPATVSEIRQKVGLTYYKVRMICIELTRQNKLQVNKKAGEKGGATKIYSLVDPLESRLPSVNPILISIHKAFSVANTKATKRPHNYRK